MSVLVVRHGLSHANNRESLAFANSSAGLKRDGRDQARVLGLVLRTNHHIDTSSTEVAVSEYKRTFETAKGAGFLKLAKYSILNEIDHGMTFKDLRALLDEGILPDAAILGAEAILQDPPDESIWVTHGLVIAGLCRVLGVNQEDRLIPRFCEIRELPLRLEQHESDTE